MAILLGEGQGGGETPSCRELLNDILSEEELNKTRYKIKAVLNSFRKISFIKKSRQKGVFIFFLQLPHRDYHREELSDT
jgi:hypothetical protein